MQYEKLWQRNIATVATQKWQLLYSRRLQSSINLLAGWFTILNAALIIKYICHLDVAVICREVQCRCFDVCIITVKSIEHLLPSLTFPYESRTGLIDVLPWWYIHSITKVNTTNTKCGIKSLKRQQFRLSLRLKDHKFIQGLLSFLPLCFLVC